MAKNSHISHDQLVADIKAGTIDTVLAVFGDHAGRLVGKRTDGEFYLDVVHEEGTENCDYLIACDLDNNPIPGFRWASYDQGYGDMRGVVDESTVRYLPWIEKTAMVIVDLVDVDTGRTGRGLAAPHAAGAGREGGRRRLRADDRLRGRVLPLQGGLRRRQRARVPRPHDQLAVPRGLPHPPDHEGGGRARRDPAWPGRRRHAGRVQQGRGRARPARAQPHLPAGASRWPTSTRSSRTPSRRSPTRSASRRRSWPSRSSTTPARAATSTPACGRPTARR